MEPPLDLDSLAASVGGQINALLREAFEQVLREAHASGVIEATQRIMLAAQGIAVQQASALPVAKSSAKPDEERRPHPNAADARRFQYGAITNSIRASLQRAGAYGLSLDDLIGLVSEKLGQAVTAADLRDTLKRLKEKDELRVENGKHRAGPNLKPLNENGAASAAPDAGEATTSPDRPD